MDVIVSFIDAITFVLATYWVIRGLKRLLNTQRTVYFVLILFYIIYILPVGIDYFITYPSYETWKQFQGFYVSYNDKLTRVIYDVWMIVTYHLIEKIGSGRLAFRVSNRIIGGSTGLLEKKDTLDENISDGIYYLLFALSCLPIILVVIKKLPTGILFTPLWLDSGLYNITGTSLEVPYYFLQKLSYISIVAAFLCLVNGKHRNIIVKIFLVLVIYALTCLEAKRAIYAIVLIMLISYLFISAKLKRKTKFLILILSVLGVVGLLSFTTEHMMQYRHYGITYNPVNTYTQIKMDFMRDDRVKFVIYKALNFEGIIQYPCQSYLTQLTALFPLDLFFPVEGFNKYFTAALLGVERGSVGGWVTTSIFDEALANMGIFSLIIIPLILGLIALYTDEASDNVKVIAIVAVALLFMLNLGYIMWYLQFCFIILYMDHKIRVKEG